MDLSLGPNRTGVVWAMVLDRQERRVDMAADRPS
jgi:hypothetical protein